jgi:GNAT superfamily N-acetyltransferase
MELRKALLDDIPKIMMIIKDAQAFLKQQGIDQWQNNYPNLETITSDIQRDYGYVLLVDNRILAYGAIIKGIEPTYAMIEAGAWLNNDPYVVVHRLAVDSAHRGQKIASCFIAETIKLSKKWSVYNLRIDTHKDNVIMQKMIMNNEFSYCGIIYLASGDQRLAYQKELCK